MSVEVPSAWHAHRRQQPSAELTLGEVRVAFGDGTHCAFTDMCSFRGSVYIAFRSSPKGHLVTTDAEIVILRSRDGGERFVEVHRFRLAGRDPRDPHLLVFREKLWVYTGAWLSPDSEYYGFNGDIDINDMLGFAVHSSDGSLWSEPKQLEGTQSHYCWRVAAQGGLAYMSARRRRGFLPGRAESPPEDIECVLLESDDGLRFRVVGFFAEEHADETAFLFEPDGAILGLVRGVPGAPDTRVVRSMWPYNQWERARTGVSVGGPLLFRWNGRVFAGGRRTEGDQTSTWLWELDELEATLTPVLELPSAGDCSYPGPARLRHRFIVLLKSELNCTIQISENRVLIGCWFAGFVQLTHEKGLVCWYSARGDSTTHDIRTAPHDIRIAELTLTTANTAQVAQGDCSSLEENQKDRPRL